MSRKSSGTLGDMIERLSMPEPNSGCYLWLGSIMHKGYGLAHVARRTVRAHRLAWEVERGPILGGLYVLHKCDNRACVNVEHLFLGTAADNAADMLAKGRGNFSHLRGPRSPRTSPRKSKLTAEQVLAIRADRRTHQAVADDFGVGRGAVKDIRLRQTWKYI